MSERREHSTRPCLANSAVSGKRLVVLARAAASVLFKSPACPLLFFSRLLALVFSRFTERDCPGSHIPPHLYVTLLSHPSQLSVRETPTFRRLVSMPSPSDLALLSKRKYALRATDPFDFASAWEHSILPLILNELIKEQCTEFAINVHNFPGQSSEAVRRVIYITLPADMDTAALEPAVSSQLEHVVPAHFEPLDLEFLKG
ncbi:hypothetical protein F5144DRAFT_574153 [Chaetomium tenue]|uniref:Uncharacterized protein n=1 Tax=Chaetomium tenue TaxID=1854479 RepID=A0ACB7P822_9PEZI|nr:hypothetical protein F5144DRAFT_574153 [Chaetomium globosum]